MSGVEKKPVVFLDYDGVISTQRAIIVTNQWIDPLAIGLIRVMWQKHRFQIVVSSTWRLFEKRAKDVLTEHGLIDALHPDWRTNEAADGSRPWEIDDWLARNGEPEFLILDDDSFAWTGRQRARWIHTHFNDGFLIEHLDQMDRMLCEMTGLKPGPAGSPIIIAPGAPS